MLKISFTKSEPPLRSKLELYDSINRIPFTLYLISSPLTSGRIYARNFNEGNFIEFFINRSNRNLEEITLVSVQAADVKNIEAIEADYEKDIFYVCSVDEEESILDNSVPLKFFRDMKSIRIDWETSNPTQITYQAIAPGCLLGINSDSFLVSVILMNLTQNDINDVFGF